MSRRGRSRKAWLSAAALTAAIATMAIGLVPVSAAAPSVEPPAAAGGTGASGTGASGTGASGTGASGTGASGIGASGTGAAGIRASSATASAAEAVTNPAGTAPRVVLGSPILSGLDRPDLFVIRGNTGYIVEQPGYIIRATYSTSTHTWTRRGVFLDIHRLVTDPSGPSAGEQGLLGLAFPPEFDAEGNFYVYYTARTSGNDTLAMFHLETPTTADPNSRRPVLSIADPYPNHNGGMLLFKGHKLFVGIGDGGSGGDPQNRAQNLNSPFGKILRINPRDPDGNGPKRYTIPTNNPFYGVPNVRQAIWSYGLRNPWRWSIDSATGDLWIGDVGQCQHEEVDHAGNAKGVNFGWRKLEGTHVYNTADCNASEPVCTSNCETLPVAEYDHFSSGNCAVTGGWVYRGTAYPAWQGQYLYGDYCSGKMWIVSASGSPGVPQDVSPSSHLNISSFAQDGSGELYAVDLNGGIYALQLTGTP